MRAGLEAGVWNEEADVVSIVTTQGARSAEATTDVR
jgi:hypothetical protein